MAKEHWGQLRALCWLGEHYAGWGSIAGSRKALRGSRGSTGGSQGALGGGWGVLGAVREHRGWPGSTGGGEGSTERGWGSTEGGQGCSPQPGSGITRELVTQKPIAPWTCGDSPRCVVQPACRVWAILLDSSR